MPRGVRLNPEHDERTRAKIQTSQIINRLEEHINGAADLKATQVTAALGLLKKTLPDLGNIEVSGNSDSPLKMVIEWAKAQGS